MKRIPTAILMSGKGTNARKLIEYRSANLDIRLVLSDNAASNYKSIAHHFGIESELNDIYRFYGIHSFTGIRPARKDPDTRRAFDRLSDTILKKYGIKLIAAAGYDWILSPFICRSYIIVNVHPGDLRAVDENGRRKYTGLGWIPTARAILNGEESAHSTTHLVTEKLDGGPIARVSAPVPICLPEGITAGNILPAGVRLSEIIRDINEDSGKRFSSSLIYTLARSVQERLKTVGDWVELPLTMHHLAALMLVGSLRREEDGELRLEGRPVKDLFLAGVKDEKHHRF